MVMRQTAQHLAGFGRAMLRDDLPDDRDDPRAVGSVGAPGRTSVPARSRPPGADRGPVGRRRALRLAAGGLVALVSACAAPVAGGGGGPKAQPHPEKRFLVRYGEREYRVNIRYVDIISESVVAVREGRGDAAPPEWVETEVRPSRSLPEGEPFASEAWRAVAVDIADSLAGRPPICDDGQTMRLARNDDEGARALYRSARQAWVVFAFCPPAGTG